MIVLDASCLVEVVVGGATGWLVAERIARPEVSLHVPHLADLEVAQTLRGYVASGLLGAAAARAALSALRDLDLTRHEHEPLLDRVWELRGNLTVYDAVYVALAEALNAELLTRDARLANAPGNRARITLLDASEGRPAPGE